jgi:plastocyanin
MKTKNNFSIKKLSPFVLLFVFISLVAYGNICTVCPPKIKLIGTENAGVIIKDHKFSPDPITVSVNSTVTWTNQDGMSHTVTSDTDLFDSHRIKVGATWSYQFKTSGTFKYHCKYHSGMVGTVIVK